MPDLTPNSIVIILMGSKSDLDHAQSIADALQVYGLDAELHIGSAHKTPEHVLALLQKFEADSRQKVYITIAGRSNALSGFTDAQVSAPVIACPPLSNTFAGADIYSSLRMPSGVAPAVVLAPGGAALLAAKILGLADPTVAQLVQERQAAHRERILRDDQGLH
jgi:5-(carboxyamino)imidazole ribonucleotide mutase/phosphoribosylaminoimidazole-succinocarboxamide synthase